MGIVLALVGCAKGDLDNGTSFGFTASATLPATASADDGDGEEGSTAGDDDESTAEGQAEGSGDGEASTQPATTDEPPAESSGGGEEESSDGPIEPGSSSTDPVGESSSDDGAEPPPEVGPWEDCDAAVCEDGTDCVEITGLRGNAPYCSAQCVSDLDCPDPATGTAIPVCALALNDAEDSTNCALLCSFDDVPQGTCPNGMVCTDLPGAMTQASLCMWP